MSEAKFTPRPWVITDTCSNYIFNVVRIGSKDINCGTEANAHLISAAPDLYDALEWAMRFVDQVRIENPLPEGGREDIAYQRAINAMTKARGDKP